MKNYERSEKIGCGSYGVVWRAYHKKTSEVVAIKKLNGKYSSLKECTNLAEVKALQHMNHPNIIKLKDIVKESDMLYLVFEYMECNLHQRMHYKLMPNFSETQIRNLCFQVFQGLAHMHANGYFHCDLKPDNLLLSKDVIKIADLGLARETNGKAPYTINIGSRWYRAPEVFLSSSVHGPAVDMWAMGAIMAELFTNQPLFKGSANPGESVMYKICSVIGSPTLSTWSEGLEFARDMGYEFPDLPGVHLSEVLPSASNEALSLIAALLSWNPSMRPTAVEALEHPFFDGCCHVTPDLPRKGALSKQYKKFQNLVARNWNRSRRMGRFQLDKLNIMKLLPI